MQAASHGDDAVPAPGRRDSGRAPALQCLHGRLGADLQSHSHGLVGGAESEDPDRVQEVVRKEEAHDAEQDDFGG